MTFYPLFSPSKPTTYHPIHLSLFKFMTFKKLLDIYTKFLKSSQYNVYNFMIDVFRTDHFITN